MDEKRSVSLEEKRRVFTVADDLDAWELDDSYYCPISCQIMQNPVTANGGVHSYEKEHILRWICPERNQPFNQAADV